MGDGDTAGNPLAALFDGIATALSKGKPKAGQAGDDATAAARGSQSLEKVRKDASFLKCLAKVATSVAKSHLHVDDVPPQGFPIQPGGKDQIFLRLSSNKDEQKDNTNSDFRSYADAFFHSDRLMQSQCYKAGSLAGQVSAYTVKNGCCTFYTDGACTQGLFSASNRQDENLKGKSNDAISSFMCQFSASCNGNLNA